ncbi:hypothetical protein M1O57_04885 [Dehalococcoidia bacterium]|nr:hypothetical protein [Dehalococcoidia bacterium]MCL0037305.1 hypothetical protein [Dehalococcoidia bacterium]MCL0049384.1 hypothetical protein [Dehalococcoidia bacterium]MCL0060059.1 hypothetical protein [Dehalococcoidia bacterium]MCL0073122.1 hypothetical protein [Dehalococcoidia bacterium]
MANDRRETFLAEAARIYDEIMLWNEEHAEAGTLKLWKVRQGFNGPTIAVALVASGFLLWIDI